MSKLQFTRFQRVTMAWLKENPTTKKRSLSRRDQTKVAWHEVPGNKRKVDPSRRDVDGSLVHYEPIVSGLRRALMVSINRGGSIGLSK